MRFAAGLSRRVWSYKGTDSSTQISTYIHNSIIEHIKSTQIINALCNVVDIIREICLGISKNKVGTYSIRSGVAMAMYLGECPVYTIMLIDCWSNKAFVYCICKKVMELSHSVSKKMLCFKTHQHIPNYNHRIAPNNPRVCNNPNNAKTR